MLGDRIRDIRKHNQLNQIEFSQRIGVSQGTLSELEQNKYNPSLETIQAIIKVFNVNATWFLFGEEKFEGSINGNDGELNIVEKDLIKNFRMLSVQEQKVILDTIQNKRSII